MAGEGNYVLKVRSADDSHTHLLTLYFLDSHAYISSWNMFKSTYDYIKDNQINWFRQVSQGVKSIERPFKPPVLEDSTFGNIEDDLGTARRKRGSPSRLSPRQEIATTLKKPNAMAIFHIPLKEVYDKKPDVSSDGTALVVGTGQEERGGPKDGDFFEKGLMKQREIGSENDVGGDPEFKAALAGAAPEVKVILNGALELLPCHGVWELTLFTIRTLPYHRLLYPLEWDMELFRRRKFLQRILGKGLRQTDQSIPGIGLRRDHFNVQGDPGCRTRQAASLQTADHGLIHRSWTPTTIIAGTAPVVTILTILKVIQPRK